MRDFIIFVLCLICLSNCGENKDIKKKMEDNEKNMKSTISYEVKLLRAENEHLREKIGQLTSKIENPDKGVEK